MTKHFLSYLVPNTLGKMTRLVKIDDFKARLQVTFKVTSLRPSELSQSCLTLAPSKFTRKNITSSRWNIIHHVRITTWQPFSASVVKLFEISQFRSCWKGIKHKVGVKINVAQAVNRASFSITIFSGGSRFSKSDYFYSRCKYYQKIAWLSHGSSSSTDGLCLGLIFILFTSSICI